MDLAEFQQRCYSVPFAVLICQEQQCYISTSCRVPRSQNKPIFHYLQHRKCKASGNNWLLRQLVSDWLCYPTLGAETRYTFSCCGISEPCEFLILLLSPLLVFTLHFCALRCQSRRVGVVLFFFLTAISLGFILLIKFLLSFFSSSNNITSVGRDVGNSCCVKNAVLLFWRC